MSDEQQAADKADMIRRYQQGEPIEDIAVAYLTSYRHVRDVLFAGRMPGPRHTPA